MSNSAQDSQTGVKEAERAMLVAEIAEAMEPLMRKALREEIPHVLASIVTKEAAEQFWVIGFETMKKQAATRTGLWVFDRFGTAVTYVFIGALALVAAYHIAGVAGVKLMLSKGN